MINFKSFFINFFMCMITIIILFIITSVIFANTNISDTNLEYFVKSSVFIPIFIFSLLTNRKIKKRGILTGMLFGFAVITTLILISYFLYQSFNFSTYSFIYYIATLLTGMLGGIIGVNV